MPAALMRLGLSMVWMSSCGHIPVEAPRGLERAEAIVVLGNRPPVDRQGRIQSETLRRVRHGAALWFRGLAPFLVMTGGPAPYGFVEADVMRDVAIRLGVPADRIRTERRSQNTIDNARETVRLLCRDVYRGASEQCKPRVIVVSSPYHLRRARELFRCAGARVQVAPTPFPNDPAVRRNALWHERIVRLAYAFFDPCSRAIPTPPFDVPSSGLDVGSPPFR